jgi:hypothetical protein
MTNSERFVKAHKMTREVLTQYPEANYRVTFSMALRSLYQVKTVKTFEEIVNEWTKEGFSIRRWQKYGKDRLYVDGYGYIDMNTNGIQAVRPGKATQLKYLLDDLKEIA